MRTDLYRRIVYWEPLLGAEISRMVHAALTMAREENVTVRFKFNEVDMEVYPFLDVSHYVEKYNDAFIK